MPSIIVYDACVLYPAALRDLLIRLAIEGLCDARWFVFRILQTAPLQVADIVERQAADLKNPPYSMERLIQKLEQQGLTRSASVLTRLFTE